VAVAAPFLNWRSAHQIIDQVFELSDIGRNLGDGGFSFVWFVYFVVQKNGSG